MTSEITLRSLMTAVYSQNPCCVCSSIAIKQIAQIWMPKKATICIFLSYQAENLKVRRSTWRSWGSRESSRASTNAKLPTRLLQQTSSKSGSLWTVSTSQLEHVNGESFAHGLGWLQDKQRSLSGFIWSEWGGVAWRNYVQSDTYQRV